jgi:branched-chain amino acid transport system permease protein
MTFDIALWLTQDGLTNGAIYALLALALLLVFSVTRVIFVPQGDFISFAALSFATIQAGQAPNFVYVPVAAGLVATLMEVVSAVRSGTYRQLGVAVLGYLVVPCMVAAAVIWAAPLKLNPFWQLLMVVAIVVPLGPIVYRIAFQPVANSSVLVLFMAAVAVHYVLQGLGLIAFGGEGLRAAAISDASFQVGPIQASMQSLLVLLASVLIMACLWLFMGRTMLGQALRATAFNRVGSRLVGIRPQLAGSISMLLAALIGTLSGLLIAPLTTIYYDTGFLIGIKGFVGAVLGGMASFPLAAVGSVALGLTESFASFALSAFKETIVFSITIPALIWLSLRLRHVTDDSEDDE